MKGDTFKHLYATMFLFIDTNMKSFDVKKSRHRLWRTPCEIVTIFLVLFTLLPVSVLAEQYFSQEPEDITANLGQDVILKCRVENQEGMMQWTRNGFGLGQQADLPGFPRYSLTSQGYLRISPVDEQDVGEYQCQVGTF